VRLNKLKIVNFRSHSATELDFDHVNVILGQNAVGKSSVRDTLSFLVSGTTHSTTKSGAGMNELVTYGQSMAMVQGDITNVGLATRSIPHSFQVADWKGTMTQQEEKLYQLLGVTEDQFICSLYSDKFIKMDSNEQKNFMFNLVGLKLTKARIQKEFVDYCKGNAIENGEALCAYVSKDIPENGDAGTFDILCDLYVGYRKTLKKEIKSLDAFIAEFKSKLPEGISINQREAIIAKLTTLKSQRDELLVKIGNARNQARVKKSLEEKILRGKTLETPKKTMAELKVSIDKLVKKYNAVTKDIAKLEAGITEADRIINKLEKFSGACPLSESVACNNKDEFTKILVEFKDRKTAQENELETKKTDLFNVSKELETERDILDVRTKVDLMAPELKEAQAELDRIIAEGTADIDTFEKDAQSLNERITNGQNILMLIENEISNANANAESRRTLDHKKQELVTMELLVSAFGPKGIKSTMLNRAMKPLEEKINERMGILTGGEYRINFRVDEDDFKIVIISRGYERRLKQLSTSERLRVGVIIQDAINQLTGLRLLVVDDLEMLFGTAKSNFWKLINAIKDEYDTIILIATGEPLPHAISTPGMKVIQITQN